MRQLSEILDSVRLGIQERTEKDQVQVNKKLNPEWEKAKDYVDSLPTDYIALVKRNEIKGFESQSGKLTRTQFDLGVQKGHQLEIVEYTKVDGSVQRAWYALIGTNSVYVRDL